MFKYSQAHLVFLRENYKEMFLSELTKEFNRKFNLNKTEKALRSSLKNHKIRSGRTGCFARGNRPWNKDTKGLIKPNSGNFKKGDSPANRKPIGHEYITSKDGYILIKVDEINPHTGAQGRYMFKHVVVWESANGPIPEGHVVRFLDGDKLNCDLDNLILLTRREHLQITRSGFSEVPLEFKPTILEIGRVEAKLFELKKSKQPEATT